MRKVVFFIALISFVITDNQKPVIGILTLPSDQSGYPEDKYSYFPASYVKHMEAAGAMIVPIPWDLSYEELEFYLERVNGIFFTGGGTELNITIPSPGYNYNKFIDTAAFIFEKAI
jgi:gamma-glutamyl hydrolase